MNPEIKLFVKNAASVMMDSGKLRAIVECLHAFPWKQGNIVVEIGMYRCDTTVAIAEALAMIDQRPLIVSIDAFERFEPAQDLNPRGIYTDCMQNLIKHGLQEQVVVVSAFSRNAFFLIPESVGMLIVDGGHDYESVKLDLSRYSSRVVSGGFIYVDDYHRKYPEVVAAVDEFLAENPSFKVLSQSYYVVVQKT